MTITEAVTLAAAAGLTSGLAAGPLLRWLPEPADTTDKPLTYRALATPRFQIGVALLVTAATLTAAWFAPAGTLTLWLVGSTLGVLAAAVDARLTWVPARLSHLAWAGGVLALIGVCQHSPSWTSTATIMGAALLMALTFLLVWRVTYPQLGFADVRTAPLMGALAGTMGMTGLFGSVLCTTVIALAHACRRRRRHDQGLQPYIPAMIAGPFASAVLSAITSTR